MNSTKLPTALRGDVLHRKSRRWALWALLALITTLPAIIFIKPLWAHLATMGTGAFMLAAAAWGLLLAGGPVAALVCGIVALFLRVEAGFAPRTRARRFGDAVTITAAMLLSFAPALVALIPPIKGLVTGYMAFRGIGQEYPMSSEPLGFWEAVTYWFMGAGALAFLASVYWRSKWRSRAFIYGTEANTPKSEEA